MQKTRPTPRQIASRIKRARRFLNAVGELLGWNLQAAHGQPSHRVFNSVLESITYVEKS